jgi:hypothetical protein
MSSSAGPIEDGSVIWKFGITAGQRLNTSFTLAHRQLQTLSLPILGFHSNPRVHGSNIIQSMSWQHVPVPAAATTDQPPGFVHIFVRARITCTTTTAL